MTVLIIRFSSFGDVLLCSAFVQECHKKFPDATIHFLSRSPFNVMIQSHPDIHYLYDYNQKSDRERLKKIQFDQVFDLQNNQRSFLFLLGLNKKQVFRFKKERLSRFLYVKFRLGIYNQEKLKVSEKYIRLLDEQKRSEETIRPKFYFPSHFQKQIQIPEAYLCIAPGSAHATKQWPIENYVSLAEKILSLPYSIVLLGGAKEADLANFFPKNKRIYNFIGQIDFYQSAHLISDASLIICNDSSIMHLANALDQQILVFFGPTTDHFGFAPAGNKHIIFQKNDLSCRPCSHIGTNTCPKKHFRCMRDIQVDTVFIRMKELLE